MCADLLLSCLLAGFPLEGRNHGLEVHSISILLRLTLVQTCCLPSFGLVSCTVPAGLTCNEVRVIAMRSAVLSLMCNCLCNSFAAIELLEARVCWVQGIVSRGEEGLESRVL